MMRASRVWPALAAASLVLASCGASGGDSTANPTVNPTANPPVAAASGAAFAASGSPDLAGTLSTGPTAGGSTTAGVPATTVVPTTTVVGADGDAQAPSRSKWAADRRPPSSWTPVRRVC
jgi:hypothetical protein